MCTQSPQPRRSTKTVGICTSLYNQQNNAATVKALPFEVRSSCYFDNNPTALDGTVAGNEENFRLT